MRILWHSNSPAAPSGYGNQTQLFTPRLAKAGHTLSLSTFYGHEGHVHRNGDGLVELPRGADLYGNDIIQAHAGYVGADVVFSLIDPFVLRPEVWGSLPWAAWTPIDSAPVLPQNVTALRAARWVIAMSRFGEEQLRAAGFDPLYVPHGVDTRVFRPGDRPSAREAFARFTGQDITGKFLVLSVAANKGAPSRKNFAGMLEAFAAFAAEHPEAVFYLHTEPEGIWQGENIRQLAQFYGVADKVILPGQYSIVCGLVSPALMNDLYNAADVFLLLSRGEGFGIPTLEAQSAGCPVIVTDFSAHRELCFTGWTVPGMPFMLVPGAVQHLAYPAEAAHALDQMAALVETEGDGALRAATREAALAYDVDVVLEDYFLPALERIALDLSASPTGEPALEGAAAR